MKRSSLLRRTSLARGSSVLTRAPLLRKTVLTGAKPLARTEMKRKRRRAKPGDEPAYKAWVKTQACVVGGKRCGKADPHHLIDGKGDAKKGMGQTAPDRYLLPMCRRHHELFHAGKGVFAHFDDAQRLTFQEQECERLRAVWADLVLLGVLQEPSRKAI